ncbi:GspS/AspS pilotin family protein [Vibrio sp. JC009]|uniref:GspS/AspS pilotin family protein n=1 Tax=Vibrio sp. JC009 TaxID=2912314 RepID=UPI0023B0B2A4|nr:GspS/AspS pilotin family protein [Vibrio sp. JC009]WED20708.1 GspS/AspS pilotin family protein [Vibrio sp. JC009]
MFTKTVRTAALIAAGLSLFGCASSDKEEERLAALASQRAQVLSAGLPIEHGPLKVMQAKADGKVIKLMMIYNDSRAIPVQKLISSSINYYCSNPDVKQNLDLGLSYQIKIRNSRGQLLTDQGISADSCQ